MTDFSTNIDITLVSGRRPFLLSQTLNSFSEGLFSNFNVSNVIVNLDPFGGDDKDHRDTLEIIDSFFPQAHIIQPNAPSFGKAVQQLWMNSESDFIFHLEDDWILEHPIKPSDIYHLFDEGTAAIQLVCIQHNWCGEAFKEHKRKRRILGIPVGYTVENIFGTSPGFWRGRVARTVASLMNPDLDPEKQMRPMLNRNLFTFLNSYKCRMLGASGGGMLITDIGREWRAKNKLIKKIENGRSVWSHGE